MDQLAPYRQLVTLAEAICAHIEADRMDELSQTQDEFGHRFAELHGPDPAEAEPLLRRAFELHLQATKALEARKAAILAELGEVRHGRTAAAGYAPAGLAPVKSVDRAA